MCLCVTFSERAHVCMPQPTVGLTLSLPSFIQANLEQDPLIVVKVDQLWLSAQLVSLYMLESAPKYIAPHIAVGELDSCDRNGVHAQKNHGRSLGVQLAQDSHVRRTLSFPVLKRSHVLAVRRMLLGAVLVFTYQTFNKKSSRCVHTRTHDFMRKYFRAMCGPRVARYVCDVITMLTLRTFRHLR
jgi:hypothetical protein